MSALLEGFKDDGCIKGLFGGDSDSSSSDEEEEEEQGQGQEAQTDSCSGTESSKDIGSAAPTEFSHYTSVLDGRVLKLQTNKLKGIAHQVGLPRDTSCRNTIIRHSISIILTHLSVPLSSSSSCAVLCCAVHSCGRPPCCSVSSWSSTTPRWCPGRSTPPSSSWVSDCLSD